MKKHLLFLVLCITSFSLCMEKPEAKKLFQAYSLKTLAARVCNLKLKDLDRKLCNLKVQALNLGNVSRDYMNLLLLKLDLQNAEKVLQQRRHKLEKLSAKEAIEAQDHIYELYLDMEKDAENVNSYSQGELIQFFNDNKHRSFLCERILAYFLNFIHHGESLEISGCALYLELALKLVKLINLKKLNNLTSNSEYAEYKEEFLSFIKKYDLNINNLNSKFCYGLDCTALPFAMILGADDEIIDMLLSLKANIEASDCMGKTAHSYAILNNDQPLIEKMQKLRNIYQLPKTAQEWCLSSALISDNIPAAEVIMLLDYQKHIIDLQTVLNKILEENPDHIEAINFLVNKSAIFTESNIHWAMRNLKEHRETAKFIISRIQPYRLRFSRLCKKFKSDQKLLISLLKRVPLLTTETDLSNLYLLTAAVKKRSYSLVKYLVKEHIKGKQKSEILDTSLKIACEIGDLATVRFLLKFGANPKPSGNSFYQLSKKDCFTIAKAKRNINSQYMGIYTMLLLFRDHYELYKEIYGEKNAK